LDYAFISSRLISADTLTLVTYLYEGFPQRLSLLDERFSGWALRSCFLLLGFSGKIPLDLEGVDGRRSGGDLLMDWGIFYSAQI